MFESSKIRFELQNYQYELSLKESQISNNRKIIWSLSFIVLLVICFFLWYLHVRSTKLKQKKEIEKGLRKIVELKLEKEKNEKLLLENRLKEQETLARLERERLKSEIELRNRQLAAKALTLSNKDLILSDIMKSLCKYPSLNSDPDFSALVQNLKFQLNSEKEWTEFLSLFEEVNHGVLAELKQRHPNLNINDIRFICYIYMGLTTKEIASIFNITVETCRKRKERIVKKMEIPEDLDLFDYIFSI